MQLATTSIKADGYWSPSSFAALDSPDTLLVLFGSPGLIDEPERIRRVLDACPQSHVIGCSTAGEIHGSEISDDTLVAASMRFHHTAVHTAQAAVHDPARFLRCRSCDRLPVGTAITPGHSSLVGWSACERQRTGQGPERYHRRFAGGHYRRSGRRWNTLQANVGPERSRPTEWLCHRRLASMATMCALERLQRRMGQVRPGTPGHQIKRACAV